MIADYHTVGIIDWQSNRWKCDSRESVGDIIIFEKNHLHIDDEYIGKLKERRKL